MKITKAAALMSTLLIVAILLVSAPAAYAAAPPVLMMSDTAGNSLTVDSTGAVNCVGSCSSAAGYPQVSPDSITWQGLMGFSMSELRWV